MYGLECVALHFQVHPRIALVVLRGPRGLHGLGCRTVLQFQVLLAFSKNWTGAHTGVTEGNCINFNLHLLTCIIDFIDTYRHIKQERIMATNTTDKVYFPGC